MHFILFLFFATSNAANLIGNVRIIGQFSIANPFIDKDILMKRVESELLVKVPLAFPSDSVKINLETPLILLHGEQYRGVFISLSATRPDEIIRANNNGQLSFPFDKPLIKIQDTYEKDHAQHMDITTIVIIWVSSVAGLLILLFCVRRYGFLK
jgi:hypothetical protein